VSLGDAFTPGSKLDDAAKRWRRLVGPRLRERRCSFRCSTDCAYEASAAFCRPLSRRSQSPVVNAPPNDAQPERRRVHDAPTVSAVHYGRARPPI